MGGECAALPSPLVGEGGCDALASQTGEGVMTLVVLRPLIRRFAPPSPTRGEGKEGSGYTDAVVTPPSTTMVWPVMKLDASEPR
jgi:hypothetical protein